MGHKAKSSGSGKAEDPKGGKKDGKKDGKKPAKDSKDGKKSTSKQQVYDYRPSGSADVFAQFAPYEERFVTLDDAEVQLALQALQKKDPTTRLRNVAELHQLLSTRPKSLLSDVCGPFLHTYLRLWPQDSEPGVREGLQRCLQVLVESLQRDFAKHLRSAFPTWLCAMFDTYTEVAQAARTAFAAAFASDEKRRNVFRHSLKECLELLTFYLRHNEQSLHEELGITRTKDKDLSLERQDRYARVLAASLSALGELVHVCAPKGGAVEGASGSLTSEQLQPFVEAGSSVGVWSRLNHKQPTAVRRAAVHCLVRILRCEAEMGLPCATAANRAAAMHVLADEAIPPSSACAMIMAFAAAGEPNDCWEGLDANKAFIQLHMLLQRAKSGVPAEAADFLTRFQELIQVFPQSAWLPGKAELLLKELVEALAMPRGAFLTSASAAWRAYFAICRTSPTVDRQWRWHPVMLFLSQRVETEEREETERMSLPEVSLTRPVLGALPKALQEELPLMPVEAVPELLEILKNSAPMLEAGGSEASCSGGGKSMWRAWVQLLQQLKSQDDASSATAELLRHQLRRLFLVLFTTDVACVFEEALEALSVLLCCDEVFREDLEDKELQEALANSASSTGVEDLNFEWPPEARLLQWPLLPWWCSLMNAKAEAAEPVGRKLVQPILEILGRRLEEEVREGLRESLLKVLLSSSNEVAFSLRLCLECFSSEFHTVESLQVQQALQQLVEQIASGELQPTSLEDALRALYVASSAMATSRCGDWMKVLVSTAESCEPQVQLRLILLVAKVVTELRVEALCEELQQLLEPLCRALLELLIRTEDADAWNMLSKLLKRLDTDQASQLLAERVQIGTGGNWLRLLLEGSSITSLSPLSLLCKARSRDRDGSSHLLPRGAIRPSQLRDSALNAARLLRDERNEDLVLLERQEPVVLEVFWEVLLVVSTGICEDEVAVQGARKIWSFLQDLQTPASTLKRFLHLCIQEVSAENSTWWLDLGCRTMLETLPVVASLQSLAVLRRVLAVCSSSSAGHAVTVAVAEEALNSVQTSGSGHPRAGWGFARAALVPYLSEEKVLALRSQMRLRLLDLCGEKKVTEPVLALAGALELRGAELCAATKTTGETSKAEASAGPLISEVVGASDGANEALDEVHEELDTGLQELLEKLLRWSQSSSSSARSDALANWASSCWEELHCSGTMASRLTRLALETLGVSSPLGSAAAAEPLPVLPGVWRLATALCRHNQWPPERWPPLLASVVAGHVDAADGGDVERRALLSTACTEDAAAAACGVVARAPVGQVEQLAMLLSACDQRLRTAAALRLQEQVWVPAQRSGEPSVAKANEALEKFEELLEAGQTGDLEEEGLGSPDAGRGELPSVSDVSYTVLYAVLGSQMTKTLWSASDALHSLASWEASHRGDDGDEEDSQNHSKWMRAAPGGTEEVGHPATSSSSPPAPQRVGAELPLETIKACVATMAAWETLLAGIDRGLLKGSPAGSSEKAEKAEGSGTGHASPAVLLAALLQLNPDQLAHDHAKVFPAQAAPASPWSSPLQPLLRLLCHLLTSPRLAGFALDEKDTSEALLSAALSQEAPVSYDVLPLAARTLLLALRVAPAAVRSFWEKLPRRRDQSLVEKLISRSFTPLLLQAEVAAATALLEAEASRLPEVEAQVIRRPRQLLLLLAREDLKAELFIQIPASFPLRPAQAEVPEKMPGIPKPRVRNWILQARQVLSGQRPLPVGQAVLMWTRSFALFFKGVKDCPICYNVIQLTTQTIPRKACPTCKNKFHNECLYQWFRTSSKTTCPLCTQPF